MSKTSLFIKKNGLALAISFISVLATVQTSTTYASGMQSQMDRLFGDMSNVTAPGAYKTQRRGVITAGRITQKSKIFQENLVSFSPPSWKAGCGGVDMYGGALSFISKEQIVALLRAVAANAKGYFFQLALSNTCKDCATWIETFQKKIQQLNQFLGNSCQLAQGLVNDASNMLPFDIQHKTDASLTATSGGFVDDFFETRQQNEGKSATRVVHEKNPAKAKESTGNITWKQLKANNTSSWYLGGDNPLLEAILTLSGSVIIGAPKEDDSGDDSTPINTVAGYQITLADLIYGGEVQVYDCSADRDECAGNDGVLNKKTVSLVGFRTKIDDMLLSDSNHTGLIYKYQHHRNFSGLTDNEKAFVESLPSGVGGMIRQLATLAPESANVFAIEASNAIALNMVYHMADSLFRSARLALANSKSPFRAAALAELSEAQRQMHQEYNSLSSEFGSISTLMGRYNIIVENVRKQQYTMQSLTKPPQKGGPNRTKSNSEP